MQNLEILSDPESYLQLLNADVSEHYWWLGNKPPLAEPVLPDSQVQQLLGRNSVEELVVFCRNRIEAFYEQVAIIQGRPIQDQRANVFFAER